MIIKEQGTIIRIMDVQSGTSKAGNAWQAREFVIEVRDQNIVTSLHFKAFGQDVDKLVNASVGDTVEVSYKPQSREYNGRWYDEFRVYGITNITKDSAPAQIANDDDLPL